MSLMPMNIMGVNITIINKNTSNIGVRSYN